MPTHTPGHRKSTTDWVRLKELEAYQDNKYGYLIHLILKAISFSVARLVELGASNSEVMGLIPRGSIAVVS